MVKTTKVLAVAIAAGALTAFGAAKPEATNTSTAPAKPASKEQLFNETVAEGKGFKITRQDLDDAMTSVLASFNARGQTLSPEQKNMIEANVLDTLIQMRLLLAKATPADTTKGKEIAARRFEEIKTRAGTEEKLTQQLKSVGLSVEELRAKMDEEMIAEAVRERELNIKVTDEEVKKFYDENPAKFEQPERVRAAHILLATRDLASGAELSAEKKAEKHKKIEELLKRARAGEDFAKLAKENSEDPGSKEKGGEYEFPRGQMVPEFENAAFALKPNEISDVITTQYGYHIIKLLEKLPPQKVELAKVSDNIREYLKGQALAKVNAAYTQKLKSEAGVEIKDEKLKVKPPVPLSEAAAAQPAAPAVAAPPKADKK